LSEWFIGGENHAEVYAFIHIIMKLPQNGIDYLRRIPTWIIAFIIVLLLSRFVVTLIFHFLS